MLSTIMVVWALADSAQASAAVPAAPVAAQARPQAPSHSVRGVVKSVDATSLVVTRSGKKPRDLVFGLNSSTVQSGKIVRGATVSVRYHAEGSSQVATAVKARS